MWETGTVALLVRTETGTVTMEIYMVVPQKIKLELLCDMAIPLVLYIQDNFKDSCRYLYTHVHSSTIHSNQKVEVIQVSMMGEWMNKCGISKQWNTVVVQ